MRTTRRQGRTHRTVRPSCATGRGSGPCHAGDGMPRARRRLAVRTRSASHPGFVRVCDSRRVRCGAPETKVRSPRPPALSLSLSLSLSLRAPTRASRRRRTDATDCGGVRCFPLASCALSHASGCTTTGGNALRRLRRKRQRRKPPSTRACRF